MYKTDSTKITSISLYNVCKFLFSLLRSDYNYANIFIILDKVDNY